MTTATVSQKRDLSLEYANRIRTARAAVKRGITAGRYNPLEVLQEPTELIVGMPIREFLLSVYKLGPKAVDKVLRHCRIPQRKPIGELTEHQIWFLDEKLSALSAWRMAVSPR
jgi:hypothetical protein